MTPGPSLGQRLEPGLDERRQAAAEHGLLAEQVGLGLLGERRLDHPGAAAADRVGVRHGEILGLAGRVLGDGDERRHAATLGVGAAHQVARALGGDHDHVDTLRRGDAPVADVEAVGEGERVAGDEERRDVLVEDPLLLGVRGEDHDEIGVGRGVGDRHHTQTLLGGLRLRRRPRAQPDDDVDAGVLQVQRVGVALAAVADDRDLAAPDDRAVGVGLVIHIGGHQPAPSFTARRRASRSNLGNAIRPVRCNSTMP